MLAMARYVMNRFGSERCQLAAETASSAKPSITAIRMKALVLPGTRTYVGICHTNCDLQMLKKTNEGGDN